MLVHPAQAKAFGRFQKRVMPVAIGSTRLTHQRPSLSQLGPFSKASGAKDMTKDIKDIGEKELTKLYAEYQAGLGRPVPAVVHRQGRSIPGCVSTDASAAWKLK